MVLLTCSKSLSLVSLPTVQNCYHPRKHVSIREKPQAWSFSGWLFQADLGSIKKLKHCEIAISTYKTRAAWRARLCSCPPEFDGIRQKKYLLSTIFSTLNRPWWYFDSLCYPFSHRFSTQPSPNEIHLTVVTAVYLRAPRNLLRYSCIFETWSSRCWCCRLNSKETIPCYPLERPIRTRK